MTIKVISEYAQKFQWPGLDTVYIDNDDEVAEIPSFRERITVPFKTKNKATLRRAHEKEGRVDSDRCGSPSKDLHILREPTFTKKKKVPGMSSESHVPTNVPTSLHEWDCWVMQGDSRHGHSASTFQLGTTSDSLQEQLFATEARSRKSERTLQNKLQLRQDKYEDESNKKLQMTQELNKIRSQLEQEKAENAHLQANIQTLATDWTSDRREQLQSENKHRAARAGILKQGNTAHYKSGNAPHYSPKKDLPATSSDRPLDSRQSEYAAQYQDLTSQLKDLRAELEQQKRKNKAKMGKVQVKMCSPVRKDKPKIRTTDDSVSPHKPCPWKSEYRSKFINAKDCSPILKIKSSQYNQQYCSDEVMKSRNEAQKIKAKSHGSHFSPQNIGVIGYNSAQLRVPLPQSVTPVPIQEDAFLEESDYEVESRCSTPTSVVAERSNTLFRDRVPTQHLIASRHHLDRTTKTLKPKSRSPGRWETERLNEDGTTPTELNCKSLMKSLKKEDVSHGTEQIMNGVSEKLHFSTPPNYAELPQVDLPQPPNKKTAWVKDLDSTVLSRSSSCSSIAAATLEKAKTRDGFWK